MTTTPTQSDLPAPPAPAPPPIQWQGARNASPLGRKVYARRSALRLSQLRLAQRAGLGSVLIQQLESGHRRIIRAYEVEALARALDVPSDELWACLPANARDVYWIPLVSPPPGQERSKDESV